MPLPLREILTSDVLEHQFEKLVGRKESDVEKIRRMLSEALAKTPSLENLRVSVEPGFNNAGYNFGTDTLRTGLSEPAFVAHELGHVQNVRESPVYQKFLLAVRGLLSLNQKAALPVMLGLRAFAGDQTRKDVESTLSGISAALAGPALVEEASATANAVINSPDKLDTAKKLISPFGSHALEALLPVIAYQVDRRI